VAVLADVGSVLVLAISVGPVEVLPCLYASSLSVDSVLCDCGKEGSNPFDFPEASLGVFLSQHSQFHAQETKLPTFSLHRLWPEVF